MTLFEILHGYRELSHRIDSYGGEVPEDLEMQLSKIEASIDDKVDGFCCLRREWEADASAAREEAKRLLALAQVKQNAADRLWKTLELDLASMEIQSHKTRRFHVYFQKSPPSVQVHCDLRELPPQYVRTKLEADKSSLLADWKVKGTIPPGVTVESGGVGLRLK